VSSLGIAHYDGKTPIATAKTREIVTFSLSSEELERAARKLSPPERKRLEGNFEEVLRRVSDLDLREGRKFRIRRGSKGREVVIPSLESKLLQYILLERVELPKRAVSFSSPGKGGPGQSSY
jgi:hypothetical protein